MSVSIEKRKARKKELNAAYYAANTDRIRQQHADYRAANVDHLRERKAAWRAANPDKVRELMAAYRAANPDKVIARRAAYYAANADKVRSRNMDFRAANPHYGRWSRAHQSALKHGALGTFTIADIEACLERQNSCCPGCGADLRALTNAQVHLDHKVPFARGGSNWPDNIHVLCKSCNLSKGSQTWEEFTQPKTTD